jgi:hypothetical protein
MGKSKRKVSEKMDDQTEDRFDASKPQFRQHKEKASKVVLDDRFASVLTDPRFKLQLKDKYGRKEKKSTKDELSAFYVVEDNDERKEESAKREQQKSNGDDDDDSSSSSSSSSTKEGDSAKEIENPASRIAFLTALSRGQIDVSSSEDDAEDEEDGDSDSDSNVSGDASEDRLYGSAGILDPENQEEVEITHEESSVLAVMNLDWTHVRAIDVFAIVSSFTPTGAVKRVRVYPSDFGMQRIAEEDQFGPRDLWKKKKVIVPATSVKDSEHVDESKTGIDSEDEANEHDTSEHSDHSERDSENNKDNESDSDSMESSERDGNDDPVDGDGENVRPRKEIVQSEFDPEKLRAYEASKLKYYFAVVEFSTPEHADKACKSLEKIVFGVFQNSHFIVLDVDQEIDGMEFEHSSAAVDMRAIPMDSLPDVVKDRPVRDEATNLPSNYVPPEFIVNALQQTNVQCSWETGDQERERVLTKYSSGMAWEAMAESDDIKAYLASDASSDEDEDADAKRDNLRKMLGLDSDDDNAGVDNSFGEDEAVEHDSPVPTDDSESESEEEQEKEFTFVPGKQDLEQKIRSKLVAPKEELTPWEKYKEKRKQKQSERRQAAREKKAELKESHRAVNKFASRGGDRFFELDDKAEEQRPTLSKAELELLVAGDGDDDEHKDYNMKDLERLERNKGKKLIGSRKRKEEMRAKNTVGTDFKVDVDDDRFKAVLDGLDGRFGIDRTDPNFKETPAMREILAEQSRRRQAKRQRKGEKSSVQKDVNADDAIAASKPSGGAATLSALVKSLKSKVQ